MTTASDPSNDLDPGTITYAYYGDGLRSSLSLSVPALNFNQSNMFTYSYRPDGLRSSLVDAVGVNNGNGNGTYAWTYSNAGRELTQSDPLTGQVTAGAAYTLAAKTLTYDSYGRVAGLQLPRTTNAFSTYSYDLEDATYSYGVAGASGLTASGASGSQDCCEYYKYSTRNEVGGMNTSGAQYANGASCTQLGTSLGAYTCMFDARSGQMQAQQNTVMSGSTNVVDAHVYAYDAAGRQTADAFTAGSGAPVVATRSYDTDSHIISQNIPVNYSSPSGGYAGAVPNYAWAADGHLANYSMYSDANSATTSYSAHWDGDTLLYVAFGGVMALYVEKLGFSENAGNGLWQTVVYDRDQTGTSVDTRSSVSSSFYGFTELNLENVQPYQPPKACTGGRIGDVECSGQQTKAQPVSNGGPSYGLQEINEPQAPLDAKRQDGYFDGTIAIQGVRAYDPSMNQWTTPDAYSGDVHDPMSQHPYMWNGNNPVQYGDPSGYLVAFAGGPEQQRQEQADYDVAKQAAQIDPAAKAVFERLESPGFTVTLSENSLGKNGFDASSNAINWDPHTAEKVGPGGIYSQSPTVTLTHEADHAQEANRNPTSYIHDVGTHVSGYGNLEEKRVVTGSETSLAKPSERAFGPITRPAGLAMWKRLRDLLNDP